LLLAYFNQCPFKQIAEMLGIPVGTVKSRLHTAVGTFAGVWKQRMKADDGSEG
jgi:RNA polymerase sigma-70 factor (ECF subfamily)